MNRYDLAKQARDPDFKPPTPSAIDLIDWDVRNQVRGSHIWWVVSYDFPVELVRVMAPEAMGRTILSLSMIYLDRKLHRDFSQQVKMHNTEMRSNRDGSIHVETRVEDIGELHQEHLAYRDWSNQHSDYTESIARSLERSNPTLPDSQRAQLAYDQRYIQSGAWNRRLMEASQMNDIFGELGRQDPHGPGQDQ